MRGILCTVNTVRVQEILVITTAVMVRCASMDGRYVVSSVNRVPPCSVSFSITLAFAHLQPLCAPGLGLPTWLPLYRRLSGSSLPSSSAPAFPSQVCLCPSHSISISWGGVLPGNLPVWTKESLVRFQASWSRAGGKVRASRPAGSFGKDKHTVHRGPGSTGHPAAFSCYGKAGPRSSCSIHSFIQGVFVQLLCHILGIRWRKQT